MLPGWIRHGVLNVVYALVILVALPWLLWQALRHGKYREGLPAKFLGQVPLRSTGPECLWLHAVSVGEVNLLKTLIPALRKQDSTTPMVVSTTTRTGFALARKLFPGLNVFYCPLDFSWAVERAFRRLRPKALILAELELWPNLIATAKRHNVGVAVVNARLSESSFRGYRRLGPVMRRVLAGLDVIAAQDAATAERFLALGAAPECVRLAGNLKFDGVETNRHNPRTQALRALTGWPESATILLAGSTQEPEERLAVETYQALRGRFPELRLIVVPRHPERFEAVARMLEDAGMAWQRRTALSPQSSAGPSSASPSARILLVDTIGELGAWWGTADIAFVGGSLGSRGGQNMLEPAAYGAAVCFGPNTRNFRDIVAALRSADAATVVADGPALTAFVAECLADPVAAGQQGARAQQCVLAGQGATARTLALLAPWLDHGPTEVLRKAG